MAGSPCGVPQTKLIEQQFPELPLDRLHRFDTDGHIIAVDDDDAGMVSGAHIPVYGRS